MRNLIDELRLKTEQLEVQQAKAQAANRAKTAFLSNMSHEIRTPLNAVLGTTELLLQEQVSPAQFKMLETVHLAGRGLLSLVDDVLDMSKAEAGKLELRSTDMDLLEVVQGAVAPQRALAQRKGIELRLEVSGELERPVRGDALRLRQVLSTLVGNAVKFTHRGRVLVSVRVAEIVGDGVRVHFAVEDTGIGMTAESVERVFEPFQQADASTTRRYGGSGLGLSLGKRVVGLMGGQLAVRSELGHGSRFEFEVAFALGSAAGGLSAADRERNAARLRAIAPHVLVVEDTEVNRTLLQTMLERMGCHVTSVEDGARALAMLTAQHDFQLVFMDWHMPVMDGLDAASRVREWERQTARPRIPIVGYTASAFADEVARCKQAGMDRVLNKPLIRSQLESVLWELVVERSGPVPMGATRTSCLDPLVIADLQALDAVESGFLLKLLGGFLERAPGLVANLASACVAGDDERMRRIAHELRGSAGNLGAVQFAAALAALEREIREHDESDRGPLVGQIEREFALARAELDALLRPLSDEAAVETASASSA
jgi:CheY-like chemotaxis protein/nitrogen-specific signal transduction histidine kinase